MDFSYLYPDCWCCAPSWDKVQNAMDWTPDTMGRVLGQKYLQTSAVEGGANPRGKYRRKPLSWDRNKLEKASGWQGDADELRRHLWAQQRVQGPTPTIERINKPHLLKAVDAQIRQHRQFRCRCSWCSEDVIVGRRKEHRSSLPVIINEGRAIAASDERLPGERSEQQGTWIDSADDTGELCNLGLATNKAENERERGSGFRLDHIIHQEPLYRLRYRPARRKRQPFPERHITAGSSAVEPWESTDGPKSATPRGRDWTIVDRDQDSLQFSNSVWPGVESSRFSGNLDSDGDSDGEWLEAAATAIDDGWEISESDDW